MSRLDYVTIAIVAVCVAALVYLIYMTTNLLGADEDPITTTETTNENSEDAEDDTYYFDDEGEIVDDSSTTTPDENYDDYVSDDELDKGKTSYDEESSYDDDANTEDNYQEPSHVSSSSGDYMVLAGTFRVIANAESMVKRLRGMGYSSASVEKMDRGAYAVALVDRFDSYSEAKSLVNQLEGKGIAALVQKKN